MLVYEQIDVSDRVDINNSKECMLCHYWYFLDKYFTYGQYLCDGCYNKEFIFQNLFILQNLVFRCD